MASDEFYALWVNRNGQHFWEGPFSNAGRAWGRLEMIIDTRKQMVLSGTQMSNPRTAHPAGEFRQAVPEPASEYGPWIIAQFDSECDGCSAGIITGSDIRSDGRGGRLCTECGEK